MQLLASNPVDISKANVACRHLVRRATLQLKMTGKGKEDCWERRVASCVIINLAAALHVVPVRSLPISILILASVKL
jgi:hypothetical protein